MYAAYVPLFPPPSSVVVAVLFVTSMSAWSLQSSSSVSGDGFWKRALAGLPVAFADGLRMAELDDPTVLCSYPRMDREEAVTGLRALSCTMFGGMVPCAFGRFFFRSAHYFFTAAGFDVSSGYEFCLRRYHDGISGGKCGHRPENRFVSC